jgi:hypothetical protein
MIDLVSANEFTFTPSAFIAAYIEQESKTVVLETTGNSGMLLTQPDDIDNLTSVASNANDSYAYVSGTLPVSVPNSSFSLPTSILVDALTNQKVTFNQWATTNIQYQTADLDPDYVNSSNTLTTNQAFPGPSALGASYQQLGPQSLSELTLHMGGPSNSTTKTTKGLASLPAESTVAGSFIELVGQKITDTRTTTKTTTTTLGVSNTVVLVLSYGTFKAKCANAQATVTLIYEQVAIYLSSLQA